jgi:O-antigen ligase
MHQDLVVNRMARMLLFVGPLTSLAISPLVSYDPINPIKNLIVCSFAFSILAMMFRIPKVALEKMGWPMIIVVFSFLGSLVTAMLFSGVGLADQFWGVFGRNNGFLSYLALVILFYVSVVVNSREISRLILLSLLITAIPMTIYCLIQIFGQDPFPWSSFAAFGTLGNVNFLSAFLGLSVIAYIYFFQESSTLWKKAGLATLVVANIGIIWQTDSIQGLMMIAAGLTLLVFFWVIRNARFLLIPYVVFLLAVLYFVVQSFLNKGPLAGLIYQPSITYRGDYMAAGWNIALSHPLTGVGLDSYGDWYRAARGVMSTFRTGYGRTTNVAHNVYLDMAANGGFPLFITFMALNIFILILTIKSLKKTKLQDFLLISLFTLWAVFQLQSLVSIAQIGVSIWGWLISGSLFGYSRLLLREDKSKVSELAKSKKPKKVTLDPASSILAFLGFSVGFVLAFLPFKADADYRGFSSRGDLVGMVEVTKNPASSAHFFVNAQYLALTNNYPDIAKELNSRLRARYPREFAGWTTVLTMQTSTEQDRIEAKLKLEEIDPLFFCFEVNYRELMQREILTLPKDQQRELAFSWGISKEVFERPDFSLMSLGQEYLNKRYDDFCA